MKAYILNSSNGIVEIGDTIFTLPTRNSFKLRRQFWQRGITKETPRYNVKNKDWSSAEEAFSQFLKEEVWAIKVGEK